MLAFCAMKASSNWLRFTSTPLPRAITSSPKEVGEFGRAGSLGGRWTLSRVCRGGQQVGGDENEKQGEAGHGLKR